MAASISIQTAILSLVLLSSQSNVCNAFQTAGTFRTAASTIAAKRDENRKAQPCRISPSIVSPRASCISLHMSSEDENNNDPSSKDKDVKFFELEDAFEDDGENIVGTKFFGGSSVKEELYVQDDEDRALELQNVKSEIKEDIEYKRFEDENAFGDDMAKRVGEALQSSINQILYSDDTGSAGSWKEDPSMKWETPFPKSKNAGGNSPLMELAASKSWYNRLDVAIISAKTIKSSESSNEVEVRWDIGGVWPNPWESRVLLTGTSILTVREDKENDSIVLLKQVDSLDGSNPRDIVGSLTSQLPPRFWDVYHIGMTPSAELDRRFDSPLSSSQSLSKGNKGKKGALSSYKVSYLPPRLVTEPALIDTNGREGRTAQALPNHGFTTAIKTMGPNKEVFVPVSPIEITISKGDEGSLIKWSVPVPPEFASNIVLPLPVIEPEDKALGEANADSSAITTTSDDPLSKFSSPYTTGKSNRPPPNPPQSLSCSYSLRPSRLVATLPYAGNPQDEMVTELRRQLYQDVVEKDGYTPKLDPVTKRPIFFFWSNDSKACFTRVGGLGMAVYEWRGDWSKSNEVGIELEC